MTITEVNIDFIKNRNGLIGFASIVMDNNIFLSSIGIHKKLNGKGFRLTYPKKQNRDVFYPINKETSSIIEKAVFDKVTEVMKDVSYDRYDSFDDTSY